MNTPKIKEFVVFDVETTGLNPAIGDRIVEVAALKFSSINGKELEVSDTFTALINPNAPISAAASQVNGITEEMLKDAPTPADVYPKLMEFCNGAVIIGHNIRFDLGFLYNELSMLIMSPEEEIPAIDTVKMARVLLPGLSSYSLWNVSRSLGIDIEQTHRAMADVELTYEVYKALLDIADRKNITEVIDILNIFGGTKETCFISTEKINEINRAIESSMALNLLYFSIRNSSTTLRKVTPKALKGVGRNMTLVGYCHLRNEDRKFKVERILQLESLNK